MGSIALASTSGCANASKRDGFEDGPDAGTLVTDDASSTLPPDEDVDGGNGDFGGEKDAGPKEGPREVYGHSKNVLYRLSPDTNDVKEIGTFDGCGSSIVDIALDEGSNLFATSYVAIYRVDKATATCTKVADGEDLPDSLSFVPKGTLDDDEEALVGYSDANYVRIDRTTGAKSVVGNLGPKAAGLISSGDIVSVDDGPTFLTVKPDPKLSAKNCTGECKKCQAADCLVEVDPATGQMLKNWGPIDHKDVFGLSFWGGKVYGFDKTGNLFEIAFSGASITTTEIPISERPTDLSFWGAGSATSAPLQPN